MFKDLSEARALAEQFLPDEVIDVALSYRIKEIGIEPGKPAEVEIGKSRIGGLPDLPAGAQWPVREGGDPYTFIAQINLAELSEAVGKSDKLPAEGLLSFFWDPENGYHENVEDGRVIYTAPGEELLRLEFPEELQSLHKDWVDQLGGDVSNVYTHSQPVEFYQGIAFPTYRLLVPEHDDKLGDLESESHPMAEHMEGFDEFIASSTEFQEIAWKRYQVLGAPCPVQSDPRGYAADSNDDEDKLTWTMLLQVPIGPWQLDEYGEGELYYCIRNEDLTNLDFSRMIVVYSRRNSVSGVGWSTADLK